MNTAVASSAMDANHGLLGLGGTPRSVASSTRVSASASATRVADAGRFVFSERQAKQQIYSLLDRKLGPLEYEATSCKALCYQLASEILGIVNAGNDCNYKMVVMVTIGSSDYLFSGRSGMDMQIASKCLWDDKEDKLVNVLYQNPSLFAVVLLYALKFS
jgi:hypothetical protein